MVSGQLASQIPSTPVNRCWNCPLSFMNSERCSHQHLPHLHVAQSRQCRVCHTISAYTTCTISIHSFSCQLNSTVCGGSQSHTYVQTHPPECTTQTRDSHPVCHLPLLMRYSYPSLKNYRGYPSYSRVRDTTEITIKTPNLT